MGRIAPVMFGAGVEFIWKMASNGRRLLTRQRYGVHIGGIGAKVKPHDAAAHK